MLVVAFIVVLFPGVVLAQEESPPLLNSDGLEDVWGSPVEEQAGPDCFDYYHFQSVQVSAGAEKGKYLVGEKVVFNGYLINENDYPIFDGNVFVRISRMNLAQDPNGEEKYLSDYHYIVDEFIAQKDIALDVNQEKDLSFEWAIPSAITAGQYRADFFFSVGKKFNLGGLPFSNEVVVGASEFEIESTVKDYLSFSRSATTINNQPYRQIGDWPLIEGDQDIVITHQLENSFDRDQKADLVFELYYWDSLDEKDKLATEERTVTIPADSSEPINFSFQQQGKSVYYLKTIAKGETQQSIINARVSTETEMPRLNYPGLNRFPIAQGQSAALFSCFHNTNHLDTQGKVDVILKDRQGEIVDQFTYQGKITSAMMAQKKDFTAKENYDYLTIEAKVYDKNNKLVDSYQAVYDCQEIGKCFSSQFDKRMIFLLLVVGLLVVAVASAIFKKKKLNK